jgi:SAM-dependent methyltransferase
MPATDYAQLAEIYDLIVTSEEDIPFFIQEASKTSGNILELMCGTGRVSVPLAINGASLTCVDSSDEMLSSLRGKITRKKFSIRAVLQDITSLNLEGTYDLAFIPYQSFHEIAERDKQIEALASICSLLTPQSKFICTLHNPALRLQSVGKRHVIKKPISAFGEDCQAVVTIETAYDAERKIVEGSQEFEIVDSNEKSVKRLKLPLRFALFEKKEFQEMAENQGLEAEAVYGDYERREFDPNKSPYMIWMFKKKQI